MKDDSMLKKYKYPIFIVLCSLLLLVPFLGFVHLFDWDEINFAEIAREMLVLDNYSQIYIRFLPFWEKPPLFFWLQALSMNVFGINEFSARFPNAVCGVVTLLSVYFIGKHLHNKVFGYFWSLAFIGSILPFMYFQSGIIDPFFNFFIFMSLVYFILSYWKRSRLEHIHLPYSQWVYLLLSGVFCGLAVLTKGPVAILILCLCFFVYWLICRFKMYVSIPQFLVFLLTAFSITLIWFSIELANNGAWFLNKFIAYNVRLFNQQDAGHGGFFAYHFVVVFLGCFPASIFGIRGLFFQQHQYAYQKDFKTWMLILLWVVLILFTIVKTKIVHYSSLSYFPVTYLATYVIYQLYIDRISLHKSLILLLRVIGSLIGVLIFLAPFIGLHIDLIQNITDDPFAKANMDANPNWTGWEALIGLMIIFISFYGTSLFKRKKVFRGAVIVFLGIALSIKLVFVFTVKKIEAYSQLAAIEFYQNHANENAYIQTINFKSYAEIFYGSMTPETAPKVEDYSDFKQQTAWEQWLLTGEIDKPVYFVAKINADQRLLDAKPYGVNKIGEKNGFVFYKREP